MIRDTLHILHNGLRLVCVEMPHLHSAELALYLKVGGRDDPKNKEGLSHFLEHILFRGTEEFPTSLELESAFEAIGGAPNAATDAESTCFYSRIHPEYLRRGMELIASMILRPLLEGIETEQKIIAEEAREDLNEKGEEIHPDTLMNRLLWPAHPLGMPTIGTLDSIMSINRDDLKRHHGAYYVPSQAVLVVAGPIRTPEMISAAEDTFGTWQGNPAPFPQPFTVCCVGPRLRFVHDSASQMSLQIAFLGFSRSDPRFTALRLLRRLLAGGGSSRLHGVLREKLGIVYSVDAIIGAYDETGCIAFELATAPGTLSQAVEVTLEELAQLASELITSDELERFRRSYLFDLEYSCDSAYEMGIRYGWGELVGTKRTIDDDRIAVQQVTPTEIRAMAQELFSPENLRLVAVGPWKRGMKKKIRQCVDGYCRTFRERYQG